MTDYKRLRTASGRAFQTPSLVQGGDLSATSATANPGSIKLDSFNTPVISYPNDFQGGLAYRPILTLSTNGRSAQVATISDITFPVLGVARGRLNPSTGVLNGDTLGGYVFAGRFPDGQANSVFPQVTTAQVLAVVDGSVTTTSYPTRIDIFLTPSGSIAPTLAVRLTSNGNVLIGNTTGTERLSVTGNVQVTDAGNGYMVGANRVIGARRTGWTAPTGIAERTAYATYTAPTIANPPTQAEVQALANHVQVLSRRLKAVIDDQIAHGAFGA